MLKNLTGLSDKQALSVLAIAMLAPMAWAWGQKTFGKKGNGNGNGGIT